MFGGEPPAPKFLATGGKDGQVCDLHPIPDETLVVDKDTKGIKNIVVFARKVSRVHDDAKKPGAEQVFDQKECVFTTHVLPVVTDVPVTIKNNVEEVEGVESAEVNVVFDPPWTPEKMTMAAKLVTNIL